jgi:hypothetical protein
MLKATPSAVVHASTIHRPLLIYVIALSVLEVIA